MSLLWNAMSLREPRSQRVVFFFFVSALLLDALFPVALLGKDPVAAEVNEHRVNTSTHDISGRDGARSSELAASPSMDQTAVSSETRSPDEMRLLVARLDAASFESRDEATQRLLTAGAPAVPFLVDALREESGEVRLRASVLLKQHLRYEDVVPHLVKALDSPFGPRVQRILRERAIQQVDDAYGLEHTPKLLKFWGTNLDAFRAHIITQFDEANSGEQLKQAIEPLWRFHDKTQQFNGTLTRLEALSFPYDHEYSPGFVIAKTLAIGLGQNRPELVRFAEQYLGAFESLVASLKRQEIPAYTVRREVADRANMTQGAASFLVRLLEKPPRDDAWVCQIGIGLDELQRDFFAGVASPKWQVYDRGVGRVHIVDMLSETLAKPPQLPESGIVDALIASAKQTAIVGNKPKALAYLDSIETFKELPQHGLDVQSGLGQQLAKRLYEAASQAAGNREYHPARIVHNRFIALIDLGILPNSDLFPNNLLQRHLDGDQYVLGEDCRLALGRYVRILGHLHATGIRWDQPEVVAFVRAMRYQLVENGSLLSRGANHLDELVQEHSSPDGETDTRAIARALEQWTIQTLGDPR